jgi:hypothetical protein
LAEGKGLYAADTSASSGGFLAFTSTKFGGYCSTDNSVTKCGSKAVKTLFAYNF